MRCATPLAACALCGFSVLQAMAAVASKVDGAYPYKVVGASLLSEVFKIVVSLAFLAVELWGADGERRRAILAFTSKSAASAAVPGVAYQVLNNLNFVTLYYLDAPTFQILGNLKIVATGVAGTALLGRRLDSGRWLALALLTLGCAVSQLPAGEASSFTDGEVLGYASALVCVGLSATMGVYTEAFMKGNRASIHFQNVQLYVFGILANAGALVYRTELGPSARTPLLHGFNKWAFVVVAANGSCGLAVSFLLRYADSIAKTYATALCIPATHVASYLAFGTPIGAPAFLGTPVMLVSMAYYYGGPALFADPARDAGRAK